MKKAVALLTAFLMLFLVSCSDSSETTDITNADDQNVIESLTEKIIESVTDNELCSVPTAPDGFVLMTDSYGNACIPPTCGNATYVTSDYLPCAKTLSGEDEEFIRELLDGKWQDGTDDCIYDGTIHYMTFTYYYSSDCGTLTDNENQRCMALTKSQVHCLNIIISKYNTDDKGVLSRSILSKDGIKLNIELSENPVKSGGNFVLTATVTNNSGRTAYVGLPTSTPNMHFEIDVKITDGKYRFVDLDTQGKCFTTDEGLLVLKDGESYTQEMNMAAGYFIDGTMLEVSGEPIVGFGEGVYNGTATFNWHFDEYPTADLKTLKLDFEVEVI